MIIAKRELGRTPRNRSLPNDPMWKNVNQYTISAGGPIIKNKTFFFASWDQNIARKRESIHSNVLTPCARKGIYRYFPGWIPGNSDASYKSRQLEGTEPPSVNLDGTPLAPTTTPMALPYTCAGGTADGLHYGSVLGQLSPAALSSNSRRPDKLFRLQFRHAAITGIVAGTNWNAFRKAIRSERLY